MPQRDMVVLGALALLIPLLLACFAAFDRLVRFEYGSYRARWESDGRPRGFFWRPSEAETFRSYLAQQRLSFTWLLSTPVWMREDPAARRLLRWLRGLVVAWHVAIICAALVVYRWVIQTPVSNREDR